MTTPDKATAARLADDREADLALARGLVRLANNAVTMGADSTARWTNVTRPALRGAAKTIERLHRTLAAQPADSLFWEEHFSKPKSRGAI